MHTVRLGPGSLWAAHVQKVEEWLMESPPRAKWPSRLTSTVLIPHKPSRTTTSTRAASSPLTCTCEYIPQQAKQCMAVTCLIFLESVEDFFSIKKHLFLLKFGLVVFFYFLCCKPSDHFLSCDLWAKCWTCPQLQLITSSCNLKYKFWLVIQMWFLQDIIIERYL